MVVAPGKDGSIALLDAASLGGADHHTPLFETPPVAKTGRKARMGWIRELAGQGWHCVGIRIHFCRK